MGQYFLLFGLIRYLYLYFVPRFLTTSSPQSFVVRILAQGTFSSTLSRSTIPLLFTRPKNLHPPDHTPFCTTCADCPILSGSPLCGRMLRFRNTMIALSSPMAINSLRIRPIMIKCRCCRNAPVLGVSCGMIRPVSIGYRRFDFPNMTIAGVRFELSIGILFRATDAYRMACSSLIVLSTDRTLFTPSLTNPTDLFTLPIWGGGVFTGFTIVAISQTLQKSRRSCATCAGPESLIRK